MLYQKNLLPSNTSFLMCSLFTLSPNEKLFKTLNLKKKVDINKNAYILYNTQNLEEFYNLLNKPSLRQLVYTILIPFLIKKESSSTSILTKNESPKQTFLLKKYLKKFKYTYPRYFQPISEKNYTPPTNKEINSSAIHSLFVILGI